MACKRAPGDIVWRGVHVDNDGVHTGDCAQDTCGGTEDAMPRTQNEARHMVRVSIRTFGVLGEWRRCARRFYCDRSQTNLCHGDLESLRVQRTPCLRRNRRGFGQHGLGCVLSWGPPPMSPSLVEAMSLWSCVTACAGS